MRFHNVLCSGLSAFVAICLSCVHGVQAAPPVIDDQKITETLVKSTSDAVGKEGVPTADDLCKKAMKSDQLKLEIEEPKTAKPSSADYETLSQSVFLIDTIYKCGKCDHWHQGSAATAWCLSEDGLMVTNAHVFRGAKGAAMGVINREGKAYPVTELLGFDVATDIAIFRVKGEGMRPLRMGTAAEVGKPVSIISNPNGNLFVRTEGSVSRYALGSAAPQLPKVPWMAVTAEYAKGSSGGPVFNSDGEVVGMVNSTRSIYTSLNLKKVQNAAGKAAPMALDRGDLQMVIRNCVPVESIRALFKQG